MFRHHKLRALLSLGILVGLGHQTVLAQGPGPLTLGLKDTSAQIQGLFVKAFGSDTLKALAATGGAVSIEQTRDLGAGHKLQITLKVSVKKGSTDLNSLDSFDRFDATFTETDAKQKKTAEGELAIVVSSAQTYAINSKQANLGEDGKPTATWSEIRRIADGKNQYRKTVETKKLPNGQTLTTTSEYTFDKDGNQVPMGEPKSEVSGLEPVQSNNVSIYTQLAAGFGWSSQARGDYFTSAKLDENGNPVVIDNKQVYVVGQKNSQQTVSTQLAGMISIAMPITGVFRDKIKPINAWGFTLGAGFGSSTSGTFSLSPYAGFSLFLGDQDSVVLTAGLSWIPVMRLKGLKKGQEIFTDQISTYESYERPKLFLGLTYRIGGSGKGASKPAEAEKPEPKPGSAE